MYSETIPMTVWNRL